MRYKEPAIIVSSSIFGALIGGAFLYAAAKITPVQNEFQFDCLVVLAFMVILAFTLVAEEKIRKWL